MMKLHAPIKKCFEAELDRTKTDESHHLCLIAEYDQKGKAKFFEFSSRKAKFTPEMKECLDTIPRQVSLELKQVLVLQPFALRPVEN